ncbi:MAG: Lrp/AsnC family transcriptional regulator [Methyloligellaceae bacterium]
MTRNTTGPRDELDRNIIRELQSNARESTSNIAAKLKVARSTVHERIVRLERDGVIKGYTVVLSRDPDEARVEALIMLSIKQQETRRVLDTLSRFTEIRLCLSINGEFDLFLSAVASRVEDLELVIDDIARIPGVLRTQTSIVFNTKFDRRYTEIAKKITNQLE